MENILIRAFKMALLCQDILASSLTTLFVEDWSGLMAVETALESRYREFESSKVF